VNIQIYTSPLYDRRKRRSLLFNGILGGPTVTLEALWKKQSLAPAGYRNRVIWTPSLFSDLRFHDWISLYTPWN